MYNFMKTKKEELSSLTTDELVTAFSLKKKFSAKFFVTGIFLFALILGGISIIFSSKVNTLDMSNSDGIKLAINPIAVTSSKRDVLTIPSGIVKANPFVPYRSLSNETKEPQLINDVPKFDLVAPPDIIGESAPAVKIMETVVSGILFDKFNPSAILNIEGTDYLVKKGDTVNNYKVLAIAKDSVTVQFGKNTYKAGIGEILTDGSVNYNNVSNLSKKFGGGQQ